MAEMLADRRSGRFDLLLAGYSDRWQRNLRRTLELLEDGLHPNGVALVMCDRKILSSDPSDWDELISEAAGAEKYSRRLSRAHHRRLRRQVRPAATTRAAMPASASGACREPPHTLEIDPDTMPIAVGLFERYALGNVSATQLEAETGLAATRIRMILMNPLYNGWIRRHRGASETRRPAPWRATRRSRTSCGRGSRTSGEPRPAAGDRGTAVASTCSAASSSASAAGASATTARSPTGRHRKLHAEPCEAWGRKARLGDDDVGGADPRPARPASRSTT